MAYIISWLPLLLVIFILTKSDAASEECSEQSGETRRASILRRVKELLALISYEYLMTQPDISDAAFRSLKLAEDDFKSKIQQSDCVISNMKATIDDLTKTVESLNHTLQSLCGQPKDACRYLLEAVKSGDVNTVKTLYKCTKDNCTTDDKFRNTPLTYAAVYGHVEVVRVLLESGANAESHNAYQHTALHNAAFNGYLDVCRLLLDWGAKVDSQEKSENTALHWAASKGHLSVVKLLVERGADVRLKNNYGQTASDMARKEGYNNVADWLDSVSRG